MAKYTKQELIDAFCAVRGCSVDDLAEIEAQIQNTLDKRRAKLQERLATIPKVAKEAMKAEALDYLADQDRLKDTEDNKDISL